VDNKNKGNITAKYVRLDLKLRKLAEFHMKLLWQKAPVKLVGHVQVNELTLLLQMPPFKHGFETHSSMSTKEKKQLCIVQSARKQLTSRETTYQFRISRQ
jgi:hypothetical protein